MYASAPRRLSCAQRALGCNGAAGTDVEPTTVGTADAAALGFLVATLFVPGWPVMAKMVVSACFALAGTALFMRILRAVPLRDAFLPPLVGVMLGGVIGAAATFIAYRYELMGTLLAWRVGDFSGVLGGRYELLWIGAVGLAVAWIAADRFTVAGLGREFTTNLGLDYRRVVVLGLVIVAVTSAVVLVSVGIIPFLGLVEPNVVSLLVGDNMRRAVPRVAIGGAGFVLACDIFGRYPHNRGRAYADDRVHVDRAIDYLGLDGLRTRFLDELSGGQRQPPSWPWRSPRTPTTCCSTSRSTTSTSSTPAG